MAEEAVAKLAKDMEDQKSDQWSDWDIMDCQEFQMLQNRVAELEADPKVIAAEAQELWQRVRELGTNASIGSVRGTQAKLQKQKSEALERVADLEGSGPTGYAGGVPRQTRTDKGRWGASVMDSKVVLSLGQLTDDNPRSGSGTSSWSMRSIMSSQGMAGHWTALRSALIGERTQKMPDQERPRTGQAPTLGQCWWRASGKCRVMSLVQWMRSSWTQIWSSF